jgi:DNA-binding Xre family transcriptional regulator
MKIKSKLKDLMASKGVTEVELAQAIGTTPMGIRVFCEGSENYHFKNNIIIKLCVFFQLETISDLIEIEKI